MINMDDVELPSPFTARLHKNGHQVEIRLFGELSRWLEDESRFWAPLIDAKPSGDQFFVIVRDCLARARHCLDYLKSLEVSYIEYGEWKREVHSVRESLVQIDRYFQGLATGHYVCRYSDCASPVIELAESHPQAALLVAGLNLVDPRERLGKTTNEIRTESLIRATIEAAKATSGEAELSRATAELRGVRQQADEYFREFAANKLHLSDEYASTIRNCRAELEQFVENRATEISATKVELQNIQAAFEEKFRLKAPTDYWDKKKCRHRNSVLILAGVFLALIGSMLWALVIYGEPFLTKVVVAAASNAKTPGGEKGAALELVRLAAVIAPAFFAIWVLRIVGRMFSTQLSLYEDAAERVTMVTTFLALASEGYGKTVVTDADRILILTALFRPSSVTASDDSPPAGILELLSKARTDSTGKPAT